MTKNKTHLLASLATAILTIAAIAATTAQASETTTIKAQQGTLIGTKFTDTHNSVTFNGSGTGKEDGEVKCKSETIAGEFAARGAVVGVRHVVATFHECEAFYGTWVKCKEATMKTEPLQGIAGRIDKSGHPAGLELEGEAEPPVGKEPLFNNGFKCSIATLKFEGHVIGRFEVPINTPRETLELVFAASGRKQAVQGFEGGLSEQSLYFAGEPTERASWTTAITLGPFKNSLEENTNVEIANS